MGGKTAKERRRLQRLAARAGKEPSTEIETKNDQNEKAKQPQKKEQALFVSSRLENLSSKLPPHVGRFTANRPRFVKDHPVPKQEETKKKPKFKKPKHLKRKIEKLSKEEPEREKLVKEWKQWEDRKMAMHPKKQQTTNFHENQVPKNEEPDIPQPFRVQIDLDGATTRKTDHGIVSDEKKTLFEEDCSTSKTNPAVISDEKETDVKEDHLTPKTSAAIASDETKTLFEKGEDSTSDSDSDVSLEEATKRQRGRRRRGRTSTVMQTEGLSKTNDEAPVVNHDDSKEMEPSIGIHGENETAKDFKKTPKKDDKRRCIGRKPVTEFVIGQRYSGKVIYIKPFGAFIDVGCHSDAFCHVSRVQDDFVESVSDALNVGDEVSARVVEVDRQAKRITVSLQSDARIDDERASIEARLLRRGKTKRFSVMNNVVDNTKTKPSSQSKNVVDNTTPAKGEPTKEEPLNESMMTPAQLKRTRKLARRAARRELSADTGVAA